MNDDTIAYQDHLIRCLELGTSAGKSFKGSKVEEKRELINLVFSNLRLKGHKLEFKLRPPFDAIVKSKKSGEWRTLVDGFRTFLHAFSGSTGHP